MASATYQLFEDQLLCPICLDVFTDPVTLPCGHNFCKKCIDLHVANAANCPFCKEPFHTTSELKVNTFISEIATMFRKSAKHQEISRSDHQQLVATKLKAIPCDLCFEPDLNLAKKSCLVCLASFCESHLEPHLTVPGLKRHQLIEPQKGLEERVCSEHDKPLELFCEDEELCICVLCAYSGHKSHDVVPFKEAYDWQRIQLHEARYQVQDIIKSRKDKIRALYNSLELSNKQAEKQMKDGVDILTALKEAVERAEDNLIKEITEKQAAAEDQVKEFIEELEQEIVVLIERGAEVKQVLRSDDQLYLLENCSHLSCEPILKDWADVSVQPKYDGIVARVLCELEKDFDKETKDVFNNELCRVKKYQHDVTLDYGTANDYLSVFSDGREVKHCTDRISMYYSMWRFDSPFVLGRESFDKNFYFEAEVKGKTLWTLGVATKSIDRKETAKLDPENGYWMIGLVNEASDALSSPESYHVIKRRPVKVGVFVDYEEGTVSFYDVEAPALLHSYTGFSFKEELYPICSPGHCSSSDRDPVPLIILKKE